MTVEYSVKNRVATVRLNRPEVFNALDRATLEGIRDSFRAASADHAVGVVVLGRTVGMFLSDWSMKTFRPKPATRGLVSTRAETL